MHIFCGVNTAKQWQHWMCIPITGGFRRPNTQKLMPGWRAWQALSEALLEVLLYSQRLETKGSQLEDLLPINSQELQP